jgi:two-component system KDP operon response regulator KdpE
MNTKVLVIAADRATERLLVRSLPQADLKVCSAKRDSAIEAIQREQPDILLTEHADLCVQVRLHRLSMPIIVLLDSTQQQRISQIMDEGADDCIVQPFGSAELQARIRAQIRRTQGTVLKEATPDLLCSEDGYIRMSISQHKVFVDGRLITLSKLEFALLRELMTQADKVLSHRLLLQRVWGREYGDEADYLRVYVNKLRNKIEPNPSKPIYLLTEARVGYVFRSLSVASPAGPQSLTTR